MAGRPREPPAVHPGHRGLGPDPSGDVLIRADGIYGPLKAFDGPAPPRLRGAARASRPRLGGRPSIL